MSLPEVLRASFDRSMSLYEDLVGALPESALTAKLPGIPSNTIGGQLWCVVGARESYVRAIDKGAWAGFSCSLSSQTARDPRAVEAALSGSAVAVRERLARLETFDDARHRLILDLLEHESAHHGQLIRYLYALRLPIPQSWKSRYALD